MSFKNILQEFSKIDDAEMGKSSVRRDILKNITRKVALTALPFTIGANSNKATAKSTNVSIDTLNFILSFQHIVAEFFKQAVSLGTANSLFPSTDAQQAFVTIRNHEAAHVKFLTQTINAASPNAAIPVNAKGYDYTLGGTLLTFNDYKTLLAVAQVLLDLSVRTYKGQIGGFVRNPLLTDLFSIQSVLARNASHVRQMRTTIAGGSVMIKPWITQKQTSISNPAFNASYAGEETAVQYGISIVGIGGQAILADAATEAFDEPLTQAEVTTIITPMIIT